MSEEQARIHDQRWSLSKKHILGKGLEIGALNRPLPVHKCVQVIYIDRVNVDDAYNVHFPELKGADIANVDVMDNAEELNSIPLESHDFIIAGHFLEHTQDPIKTIKSHLSRIKVGGILYYILPDKRFTFDIDRSVTPFEHLLRDYKEGASGSYDSHMYEYAELVDHAKTEEQIESRVKQLKDMAYTIHFHAWDAKALKEFFEKTNEVLEQPYVIVDFLEDSKYENIVVLRKVKSERTTDDKLDPNTPLAIRELMRVYERREDLRRVFPEAKDGNFSRLLTWAKKHGVNEDLRLFRFSPFYET
jgi:predicted SAM-dependent methyltransferase